MAIVVAGGERPRRGGVIQPADERHPLTLVSPIVDIDARLAKRRSGIRRANAPAFEVLADAFDIHTVGDLAHHYPRRYIDRSSVETIGRIRIGAYVTVIGRVRRVDKRYTRKRQSMVTVKIGDGTGFLDLPFFNQPWTAGLYREDMEVAVSGVATMYKGRLQLAKQEVEILRGDEGDLVHTGRITPVHAATDGISARTIRELVHRSFARLGPIADPLPVEIVRTGGSAPTTVRSGTSTSPSTRRRCRPPASA